LEDEIATEDIQIVKKFRSLFNNSVIRKIFMVLRKLKMLCFSTFESSNYGRLSDNGKFI